MNSANFAFWAFSEVGFPLYGVLGSTEHRGGPGLLLPKPRPPTLEFSILVSQLLRSALRSLAWCLHFRCSRVILWLAALQSVQPPLKVAARRHGGVRAVFATLSQDGRPPGGRCAPREDRKQRTPIDVGGCLCPRQVYKGRKVVGV